MRERWARNWQPRAKLPGPGWCGGVVNLFKSEQRLREEGTLTRPRVVFFSRVWFAFPGWYFLRYVPLATGTPRTRLLFCTLLREPPEFLPFGTHAVTHLDRKSRSKANYPALLNSCPWTCLALAWSTIPGTAQALRNTQSALRDCRGTHRHPASQQLGRCPASIHM